MEQKEFIAYFKGNHHPLKDFAEHFQLSVEDAQKEIQIYLDNGIIIETLKGYMLTSDCRVTLGTIVFMKDNYAFIQPVGSSMTKKDDIRVAGKSLDGYILNDKVYFQVDNWNNGTIVGLYYRNKYLSGTVFKRPNGSFFLKAKQTTTTDIDIHLQDSPALQGLSDGDLVKCEIISSARDVIEVSYVETLAKASEVGADISAIIASNDAPLTFPTDVLTQAKMIPQTLSKDDLKGREDYRNDVIVTIDGADALDFDDAVSCIPFAKGYRIGVYIADVSYYVRPNTPLDEEAINRGTSIYVADRVVPMLPTELSNGICSLNPNVDRLVMAVIMDIDESGNIYRSEIHPGVICSHGRLTYQEVNELFKDNKKGELSEDIVQMLFRMHEATKKIRFLRERNGALDLDSTELKFALDENGNPTEVIKRTQGEGEDMIEDLMIIANVEVAKFLSEKDIPTLYRVHDNPPSEKIELFKQFLRQMKMVQDFPSNVTPATLSHWFSSITDPKVHQAVSSFLLRSLAKAKYSPDNTGHFGLAEPFYLHFTSPIRRYPDLIVHRTLRDYVFNQETFNYNHLHTYLENLGVLTSAAERRAVEIEREVDDLEACKYMSNHLDETFQGIVTGINAKGLYVELDNGIEVFVALRDIDPNQRWIYSDRHMDIQNTERDEDDNYTFYRLGTAMEVIISEVTMEDKTIHAMTQKAKDYNQAFRNYESDVEKEDGERSERPDYSRVRHGGYNSRPRSSFGGGYRGKRDSFHSRPSYSSRPYEDERRDEREQNETNDNPAIEEEKPFVEENVNPETENTETKAVNAEETNPAQEESQTEETASLTRFVSGKDSMDTAETKRRMENTPRRPSFGGRRDSHSSYRGGRSSYGHDDHRSFHRDGDSSHRGYGRKSYHDGPIEKNPSFKYSDKQFDLGETSENQEGGERKDYSSRSSYGHDDHRSFHKDGDSSYRGGHSSYGHDDHRSFHKDGDSSYRGGHSSYEHDDHRSFHKDGDSSYRGGHSSYGHDDHRSFHKDGDSSYRGGHSSYGHDDHRSFHKDGDSSYRGGHSSYGHDDHRSFHKDGGSSYRGGNSRGGYASRGRRPYNKDMKGSDHGHGGEGQEGK
ncbi:MAG: ribonuclease R [Bacilli bacterium]|nr:ribonuclease R [Bacilli bacterium]